MNRFQFVDDHHLAFGVKRLCQVLGLNRSSYYKWRDSAEARTPPEIQNAINARSRFDGSAANSVLNHSSGIERGIRRGTVGR